MTKTLGDYVTEFQWRRDSRLAAAPADALQAAGAVSDGAMVALVPTPGNTARLTLEDGEAADQLHATVLYLGKAALIDDQTFATIMGQLIDIADEYPGPIIADGFNVALFNPHDDERDTCATLGLSGHTLHVVAREIQERVRGQLADSTFALPEQHEPWIPHVTLAYTDDHTIIPQLADRTGDVTFDRIRLAVGDDVYDIPLIAGGPGEDRDDDGEVHTSADAAELAAATSDTSQSFAESTTAMYYNDRGGEVVSDDADVADVHVVAEEREPGAWSGILIVEDVESGDGRMFAADSLKVAPLPLPLMWQKQTDEGHKTAVQVGRIDEVWREDNQIWGQGVFDLEGPDGQEAYRQVEAKFLRGVSGDVDSVKDSDVELVFPKVDGLADEGLENLFATPELTIFHQGRLRGATLVQFPAFVEASISLDGAGPSDDVAVEAADEITEFQITARGEKALEEPESELVAGVGEAGGHLHRRTELTACGCVDEAPPREFFHDPKLTEPTPLTVTDGGRVFGHAAIWGTCHTGFSGTCVTPPREKHHEYFLLGETLCADGSTVSTGTITLGTGHAATGPAMTPMSAMSHYDHTGTVVADITTGEDAFGLWFSGAIRTDISPIKLRSLRAAKLSGDWRRFGNGLRLIALLAVNVPGFPVPRVKAASSRGRQTTLVAAGVNPYTVRYQRDRSQQDALRSVVASIKQRIGRDDKSRLGEMRARVHGR